MEKLKLIDVVIEFVDVWLLLLFWNLMIDEIIIYKLRFVVLNKVDMVDDCLIK